VPYISCPTCGLRTYSAATWSNTDQCPRCDCDLPPRIRTLAPIGRPSQQRRRTMQMELATTALRQLRERPG
jgi:hypothetical protein